MLIIQIIGWCIVIAIIAFLTILAVGPAVMDWRDGRW